MTDPADARGQGAPPTHGSDSWKRQAPSAVEVVCSIARRERLPWDAEVLKGHADLIVRTGMRALEQGDEATASFCMAEVERLEEAWSKKPSETSGGSTTPPPKPKAKKRR